MRRLTYLIFVIVGYWQFCIANDHCCDNDSESQECDTRGHVQLFFSGTLPAERIQDPREDYEWPGMNEDSFYDYFTK